MKFCHPFAAAFSSKAGILSARVSWLIHVGTLCGPHSGMGIGVPYHTQPSHVAPAAIRIITRIPAVVSLSILDHHDIGAAREFVACVLVPQVASFIQHN